MYIYFGSYIYPPHPQKRGKNKKKKKLLLANEGLLKIQCMRGFRSTRAYIFVCQARTRTEETFW